MGFSLTFFYCSESSASEAEVSQGGSVKSKHREDEDITNAETHEAKRLKFDDENYEDEMEKRQEGKESPCSTATESSPDKPQSSSDVTAEVKDNKRDEFNAEDQGMCLIFHKVALYFLLIYKVTPAALLGTGFGIVRLKMRVERKIIFW